MNFISTAIGNINYPDRIRVDGAYTDVAQWNSGLTDAHIQGLIASTNQTNVPYSLLQEFASLITNYNSIQPGGWPIGALIFISDTSPSALLNADRLLPQLQGVILTFVLMGPGAQQEPLETFSSNFITWSDLSQPQPDNWYNLGYSAYGCKNIIK